MSQDCERHVAVRGRIEKSDHNRCSDSKKKMLSKLLVSLALKRGPKIKSSNEIDMHTCVGVCRETGERSFSSGLGEEGRVHRKKQKNGNTIQFFFINFSMILGLLVAQMVKNLPAVQETQETWVQSQGQEDPLEKGMATHSIDFLQ